MKVILLKSVPKLGKKDDIIDVAEGYANNALFAKKLAVPATAQAIAAVKRAQDNKVTEKKIQHDLLDKAIASLPSETLVYKTKANEKGSLFSKIAEADIAKALFDQHRLSIDAALMIIEKGPIKQLGDYVVTVKEGDYKSSFTVSVQ